MVEIRRLTVDELQDFLKFMDGPAFESQPQWAGCYCQFYLNSADENQNQELNRQRSCDRIANGTMNGYLAYEGDEVIGWVAANSANNFKAMPPADQTTARILCFSIQKAHQGRGIATKLLNHAISDLHQQGFRLIEAAPVKSDEHNSASYRGTLSMFLKAGFAEVVPLDEKHVLVHRDISA